MPVLVSEPHLAASIQAERAGDEASFRDEVWDGVYVVSPIANNEHQWLLMQLGVVFYSVIDAARGDRLYGGIIVSDRAEGWQQNYRIPDLALVLRGNTARDLDTHLCGGPDLVVEVLSPGDLARQKLTFYAKIGVREVLVIDRGPWSLELYRLEGGDLSLVGRSDEQAPVELPSRVLPLSFRLVATVDRARVEVRRADGTTWTI